MEYTPLTAQKTAEVLRSAEPRRTKILEIRVAFWKQHWVQQELGAPGPGAPIYFLNIQAYNNTGYDGCASEAGIGGTQIVQDLITGVPKLPLVWGAATVPKMAPETLMYGQLVPASPKITPPWCGSVLNKQCGLMFWLQTPSSDGPSADYFCLGARVCYGCYGLRGNGYDFCVISKDWVLFDTPTLTLTLTLIAPFASWASPQRPQSRRRCPIKSKCSIQAKQKWRSRWWRSRWWKSRKSR